MDGKTWRPLRAEYDHGCSRNVSGRARYVRVSDTFGHYLAEMSVWY